MPKTVPKSKASFPAVSQQLSSSALVAITASRKGERPLEENELLTEKSQQAHTAPSPTCQVATPVAVGAALNHFQSTCHCPS